MTTWKHIPTLPKRFEASTDGEIRTLDYARKVRGNGGSIHTRRFKGRILKQRMGRPSWRGVKQPVVSIYKGDSRENSRADESRVAYLVCITFHGIPWTEPIDRHKWRIRFKDNDFMNCSADNLEWAHSFGETGAIQVAGSAYDRNVAELQTMLATQTPWQRAVKLYGLEEAILMYTEDGLQDEIPADVLAAAA